MELRRIGHNNQTVALIVDEELHSRQRLSRLLREIAPEITTITEASTELEAIKKIEKITPNIIFVACPTNGELSKVLTSGCAENIPKISICKDYQVTKEIVRSLGGYYLQKPVDAQHLRDLLDALSAFRKRYSRTQTLNSINKNAVPKFRVGDLNNAANKNGVQAFLNRLVVRRQGRFRLLPVEKVLWFGTEFRLVYAYTEKRRYPIDLGLEQLEKRLDPELFVRIHRSAIVNTQRIKTVVSAAGGRSKVLLNEPLARTLPLSASRARPIKNLIHQSNVHS